MTVLYLARRKVYRDEVAYLGPYDSEAVAFISAKDSLYPEAAEVIPVNTSTIESQYHESSSYPDWVVSQETTFYGFSEDYVPLSKNIQTEFQIEEKDFSKSEIASVFASQKDLREEDMILRFIARLDIDFQYLYVLRPRNAASASLLILSAPFDLLVRSRGFSDRRFLLDTLEEADYIAGWTNQFYRDYHELATRLTTKFWHRLVVDHSEPPEADLDLWGC